MIKSYCVPSNVFVPFRKFGTPSLAYRSQLGKRTVGIVQFEMVISRITANDFQQTWRNRIG